MTEGKVRAAVREAGVATLREVKAVVLEADGSFAIVTESDSGDVAALVGVAGVPTVANSRNRPGNHS